MANYCAKCNVALKGRCYYNMDTGEIACERCASNPKTDYWKSEQVSLREQSVKAEKAVDDAWERSS